MDIELTLVIPNQAVEPIISSQKRLPQQKSIPEKETLNFEEYFFLNKDLEIILNVQKFFPVIALFITL